MAAVFASSQKGERAKLIGWCHHSVLLIASPFPLPWADAAAVRKGLGLSKTPLSLHRASEKP